MRMFIVGFVALLLLASCTQVVSETRPLSPRPTPTPTLTSTPIPTFSDGDRRVCGVFTSYYKYKIHEKDNGFLSPVSYRDYYSNDLEVIDGVVTFRDGCLYINRVDVNIHGNDSKPFDVIQFKEDKVIVELQEKERR
jgi:hypothetical protein